jgi:hypothetical protein
MTGPICFSEIVSSAKGKTGVEKIKALKQAGEKIFQNKRVGKSIECDCSPSVFWQGPVLVVKDEETMIKDLPKYREIFEKWRTVADEDDKLIAFENYDGVHYDKMCNELTKLSNKRFKADAPFKVGSIVSADGLCIDGRKWLADGNYAIVEANYSLFEYTPNDNIEYEGLVTVVSSDGEIYEYPIWFTVPEGENSFCFEEAV